MLDPIGGAAGRIRTVESGEVLVAEDVHRRAV